ncbi:hypothetical protein [Methylohalobius crimeensis]|uniref:hypothetical protein n=1 Tax=Methylohalobius crimeensis TaxID=244365 RepID=UPI0003B4AEBF|nr:hypothetical protein [Methylohalobius crimeensis]
MKLPCDIDLNQARSVLSDMGIELTERQMKRAAETDAHGNRKLPFFVDRGLQRRYSENHVANLWQGIAKPQKSAIL